MCLRQCFRADLHHILAKKEAASPLLPLQLRLRRLLRVQPPDRRRLLLLRLQSAEGTQQLQ